MIFLNVRKLYFFYIRVGEREEKRKKKIKNNIPTHQFEIIIFKKQFRKIIIPKFQDLKKKESKINFAALPITNKKKR